MPKIFISYRREDSEAIVGRLDDHLVAHFGRDQLFLDVDTIPFGVDFRAHLDKAVSQCDVLLAVMGEHWLDVRYREGPRAGQRRLDDPEDFVRIEIESALARSILVIPVLVGRASMPRAEELPEKLRPLSFRNAAQVGTGRDFRDHVDRLIRGIEHGLKQVGAAQEAERKRQEQEAAARRRAEEEQRQSAARQRQQQDETRQRAAEEKRLREEQSRREAARKPEEQQQRAEERRQAEARQRLQESMQQRQWEEEERQYQGGPQNDAENQLVLLVREALTRTGGKPTRADHDAVAALVRQSRMDPLRASALIGEAQKLEQWQTSRPTELATGLLSKLATLFRPAAQPAPREDAPGPLGLRSLTPRFPWSLVSASRIQEVVGAEYLQLLSKEIQIDHVSFQEPGSGRLLLDDVSVTINAGQRIALVGSNELEKHAFLWMLLRLVDPVRGEIRIDEKNIRGVTLESLRTQIGLVMQHNLVFPATVANNIGCGDESYTLPQIVEAAKIARAHNPVARLPQGYLTIVGNSGPTLSHSEQYRIALARAILVEPALLILEEPGTALDEDTVALVNDTLARILPHRTVIFLPRRIATLESCDKVLLLHKGRLEAVGDHRTLLGQNALYRHVVSRACIPERPRSGAPRRGMRLTLRTFLAYLDDTLDPGDVEMIGQKVAESDAAQELRERIRKVVRRRGLKTPTGPQSDPNTVAEYLDNQLANEDVAELEKTCLESDVHLAEVAAVHQALVLLLGVPVEVAPKARQRMYALVGNR